MSSCSCLTVLFCLAVAKHDMNTLFLWCLLRNYFLNIPIWYHFRPQRHDYPDGKILGWSLAFSSSYTIFFPRLKPIEDRICRPTPSPSLKCKMSAHISLQPANISLSLITTSFLWTRSLRPARRGHRRCWLDFVDQGNSEGWGLNSIDFPKIILRKILRKIL